VCSMKSINVKAVGRVFAVAAVLALSAVLWVGCGGDDNPADNKDNNSTNNGGSNNNNNNNNGGGGGTYDFVELGGLKWMKKNLNIEMTNSWCYDNKPENCTKYGRLYTWTGAKTVCPAGWRLPTREDWDNLAESVGGTKSFDYGTWHSWDGAGKVLKAKSGWEDSGNGTDDYGFSALPGGSRNYDGYISGIGFRTRLWTATAYVNNGRAYCRYMNGGSDELGDSEDYLDVGNSVRCVK